METESLYINSIDECVSNIIDTFYLEVILDKQLSKKLENEDYILKNYDSLKKKLIDIINNKTEFYKIKDIINSSIEYINIINLFTNYGILYYFFYLGVKTKLNTVLDILNKLNNKEDFFKNPYLGKYSFYYKLIQDFLIVLKNLKLIDISQSQDNYKFINDYKDAIQIINSLDKDVIISISENKEDIVHNILKIIIFREIYIKEDKLTIFKILENEEFATAEYKYIEIIDAKYDTVDYVSIENLFNSKDVKKGLAEEIYQMIIDYEINKFTQDYPIDTKINHLFKQKILIPITDEFLRYHKDSELYDKNIGSKIDPKDRVNKKDNTKIRYIVTKINKVKDYYSPKVLSDPVTRAEIEKYFYQPLMYRKAIIINDIEEINILRKLELQGKSVTDTNEYYEDLKMIRKYPFIEFKFTNNDSFSFSPNTTIDAIRYCNFEYRNDPRFSNILNTELQYRVINDSTKANIVGVAIPRFNLIDTNDNDQYNQSLIQCYKVKDTMDMSLLHNNSFKVCLKKLRKLFLEDRRYSKMLYWIFNKKNDKIKLDLFDNIKELPKDDYIKLLLGKIYDEMVDITYQTTLNHINRFKTININTAKNILRTLESKLVLIPRESIQYAELMKLIYYIKSESLIDIIDKQEEKIPGIDYPLIKLPKVILEKIAIHIINISKTELNINFEDDSDIYEGCICQHILTWNSLLKYKKVDPNKFNQELYNFIKKYVTENKDKDFVCKSCYQLVDLRNYTTEIYPGSDSIAISYGLDTELETISEYVKYTKSIKNLDKIIEKISYSANISYFVGANQQTKFRRQEIIKNIIDMIDIQYKTSFSKETNARKLRLEKSIKIYGCSLTNFFLFKLDNDIFTYSSQETDKFKLLKMNNILTYVMMGILLELNFSQIIYLSFDKLVNYFLFSTFGFNLFDNLYIRISNKNDIAPIKNYKLLCYIIYYLSGVITRYNMWYSEDIPFKPNNINPQIQRSIIHTFVDAINTILEANTKENRSYLYNIFATKFFNKLNTMYDNNSSKDIIQNLDNMNKKKVTITVDKKVKYNIKVVEPIPFEPYTSNGKYMMESPLGIKSKIASYPTIKFVYDKIHDPTLIELVNKSKLEEINNRLYEETLIKIGSLYDKNGIKRNIQLNSDDVKKIPIKQLKEIYEEEKISRLKNFNKIIKKSQYRIEKLNIIDINNKKYLDEFKKKLKDDINNIIENFIEKLESLIGKNININNSNFYLNHDVYVISNDYRGNKKSPIFISEKENKIKFKKNEQFFKQDVYYYEDSANQVTVYYSSVEKYLIGYKESSKDYVNLVNTDCYLKINYSIYNQLKYFGFNYINYKFNPKIKNISEFINNILGIRLQNIKNSLSIIQQIIYQVKNNYLGANVNPISKVYMNKIKSINTYDDGNRIYKDWDIINRALFHQYQDINPNINITILPNTNQYLSADLLLKFITNDDIILYYIIDQFNMLLDINDDNYTKVNLSYMIVNIIMQIFRDLTKNEIAFYDINVKKFYQSIINMAEVSEIHDDIDYSSMTEEEIEKLKEEQDIDRERLDALDADQEETNEDFGDEDIIMHDRTSGEY